MFAEQRVFRGIAVRFSGNNDLKAVRSLLDHEAFSDRHVLENSDAFSVQHLTFRSATRFTISPLLEQARATDSNRVEYDYDLYIIRMVLDTGPLAIIAVPFRSMFREILPIAASNAPSGGVEFEMLQLGRSVETIFEGQHEGGFVTLTAYEALVEGDPPIRLLQMTGPDTIHSDTYKVFRESRRFRLSPRRCTFSYDDHTGNMIQLSADRYGNFSFRVTARAKNLHVLSILFAYFSKHGLTRRTWSSPFDRLDPGDENEES